MVIEPMAAGVVAKQLRRRNVVDTGILKRVKARRRMGAANCRKVKLWGALSNPLANNL